ncbi:MAG: hypothetical protein M3P93_00945 [Actinomycetota bacterium]|nr:hypothetical protein [Actinomycetota bacterium]
MRRLKVLVLTMLAALTMTAFAATSASAAPNANVYLRVGNHHCHSGGTITGFYGMAVYLDPGGQTWSGGDWGDNVIYPRVQLNAPHAATGWAHCSRPWWRGGNYRINLAKLPFWPSYHGQWIGV